MNTYADRFPEDRGRTLGCVQCGADCKAEDLDWYQYCPVCIAWWEANPPPEPPPTRRRWVRRIVNFPWAALVALPCGFLAARGVSLWLVIPLFVAAFFAALLAQVAIAAKFGGGEE